MLYSLPPASPNITILDNQGSFVKINKLTSV